MGNTGANADPNYVAPTNTSNGNPGFEYEVVFETNFQVAVFSVDGTASPGSPTATYSLNTNSQISVALSTDSNTPDYFYDWYVPLSAIGSPSSIRMVATTVTSPNSALQGSRSDIYGIDDANTTVAGAWTTVANAQAPITITGSGISSVSPVCTAAPTLNSPILPGSSVNVTGTWTRLDASKPSTTTITLYKTTGNTTTTVNTTTVNTGSTWTISVSTVVSGDIFYAKAVANTETQCLQSNNVTAGCTTLPTTPTVTSSSTKGICGTTDAGTVVNVYLLSSGTGAPTFVTSVTPVGTSYSYGTCSGAAGQISGGSYMLVASINGCLSAPVFDCNSGGNATANPLASNTATITGTVYPYQTSISGTIPTSSSVQLLRLFINGVYFSSQNIPASTTTYTFNYLSLMAGDRLQLFLQTSSGCATVSSITTVSCYTAPPIITTNSNGNLLTSSTSISGTSTYIGATVTLYKGTSSSNITAGTATVNGSGVWTVSGLTLAANDTYFATQTYSSCTSSSSATATVLAPTTTCPAFSSATYAETVTSVGGTIPTFTGTVRLYLDGTLIGSQSLSAATSWSITVNSDYSNALYSGGSLTVTAQSGTGAESSTCATATVTCTSPITPSVTPTSSSINTGSNVTYTVSNVASNTWYALLDNSGTSYATSIYTNNSNSFSYTTNAFNSAGTYNLKLSADKLTGCASSYTTLSVAVSNIALPVKFISINAARTNEQNTIVWKVADEKNVRSYIIEKSLDCNYFQPIGEVNYLPGTQASQQYSFVDAAIQTNVKTCYRIKQVDNDGHYVYSNITSVAFTQNQTFKAWPNPASNYATISLTVTNPQMGVIELIDVNGRKVLSRPISLQRGSNSFSLENISGFGRGSYFIKVITTSGNYYRKLIIK